MSNSQLIEARNLSFSYGKSETLSNINFSLNKGENLGILGESGSGKSTLLKLLVGLMNPASGELSVNGAAMPLTQKHELREFHRNVQMIFQDPHTSIDPRQKIRSVISEPLQALKIGPTEDRKNWIEHRVVDTLAAVGLNADALEKRAREFSGGQRQRIAIARAIISEPKILLADEPVSALDLSTKVRVIELLSELIEKHEMSIVLVSHDIASIAAIANRTIVMKSGQIVESADTATILSAPDHPYTKALLSSVLRMPAKS